MWYSAKHSPPPRSTRQTLLRGLSGVLLGLSCLRGLAFETYQESVLYNQWPQQINASNVLALPALRKTLARFVEHDDHSIVIRYPGGDLGRQWAQQVQAWLVAHGIPLRYLEIEASSGEAERLWLVLLDRDTRQTTGQSRTKRRPSSQSRDADGDSQK